jgi:hypothetical protein
LTYRWAKKRSAWSLWQPPARQWPGIVVRARPKAWAWSEHASVRGPRCVTRVRQRCARSIVAWIIRARTEPGNCVTRLPRPRARQERQCLNVMLKRSQRRQVGREALFGMRGLFPVTLQRSRARWNPRNVTAASPLRDRPAVSHAFRGAEYSPPWEIITPPTGASWRIAVTVLPLHTTGSASTNYRDSAGQGASSNRIAGTRPSDASRIAKELALSAARTPGWSGILYSALGGAGRSSRQPASLPRCKNMPASGGSSIPRDGCFWSHGFRCARPRAVDTTPIDERAEWFENLPGDESELREFPRKRLLPPGTGISPDIRRKTFALLGAKPATQVRATELAAGHHLGSHSSSSPPFGD